MGDCTGNAEANVKFRSYRLSGNTDLIIFGDPAFFHCCTGSTDAASQKGCQLIQLLKPFCAADAAAAADDDLGILDISLGQLVIRSKAEQPGQQNACRNINIFFVNRPVFPFFRICHLKDTGFKSTNLRIGINTDICIKFTIIGRSGPVNACRRNKHICTLTGNTGMKTDTYSRSQVSALCCCTDKYQFRHMLFRQFLYNISCCLKEKFLSDDQRLVRTISKGCHGCLLRFRIDDDCYCLFTGLGRQHLRLLHHFEADSFRHSIR